MLATIAAVMFATVSLVLAWRLRAAHAEAPPPAPSAESLGDATPRPARLRRPPPQAPGPPAYATRGAPLTRPLNGNFTTLTDADVAGRYRFFEESGEVGVITLVPDHTMINKEGITIRQYRWELQTHRLVTHWRRSDIVFNDMEKPGVYIARREDGIEFSRLEKLQE